MRACRRKSRNAIFKTHAGRRIVLATNVAETSLTVPGIRYVIDPGLARVKRYSYRNKVEQLQVERISQAAAQQRAGRCGRVAAGLCIRLYDEQDFGKRPAYTDPEILRASLAAVILRMKSLGLGTVEEFPFIDPPAPKAISDGYALLQELGAVDDARELTDIGRSLARLPVDPRIGRMVLAAHEEGSLAEVLVIAAALAVQDPRERPLERAQAADAAQKQFADERSDFLGYLKLWKFFEDGLHHESNRKLQKACREHFLSFNRMREWRDIHAQLKELAAELGWKAGATTQDSGQYDRVHRALLTGLLGNVGLKSDDGSYQGARGIKFWVHPGSSLGKKAPRWIMAAELTETTRLFARSVAGIEPEWLERLGAHLLKRSHTDPHWERKPAQVVAFERGTLYGLPVYVNRRIHYGPLDPKESRRIFIRQALVEGDWESRASFFQHNQRLVREIEKLEHKSRRPDVLVDDELIFAFYDSLIPEHVHNGAAFEAWRAEAEREDPQRLLLKREDLMRHEAAGITTDLFPPALEMSGRTFALEYLHDPGGPRDGVTMTVPLIALNQVSAARCEWLVPGLLKEKVQLLAKSLPQKLRHRLGPLPEFGAEFVAAVAPSDTPLAQAIARHARETRDLVIPLDGFRPETVPAHLWMNFRVLDEHGRQLGMGRNLAQLRAELGREAGEQFAAIAGAGAAQTGLTDWSFGPLEDIMELKRGGQTLIGHPALVDRGDSVDLEVFDAHDRAQAAHRAGLRRLFMLRLKEQARYVEKSLSGVQAMVLQYANLGDASELRTQLVAAAFERACMADPLPRDATDFDASLRGGAQPGRADRAGAGAAHRRDPQPSIRCCRRSCRRRRRFPRRCGTSACSSRGSCPKDFVLATPWERLQHFPRYLKAAALRLDKLRADPARDARALGELAALETPWLREDAKQRKTGDGGPAARSVPLAARGAAGATLRAGAEDAGAGVRQAAAQDVADYQAVIAVARCSLTIRQAVKHAFRRNHHRGRDPARQASGQASREGHRDSRCARAEAGLGRVPRRQSGADHRDARPHACVAGHRVLVRRDRSDP